MAAEESKGGDKGASWTCSLRVNARCVRPACVVVVNAHKGRWIALRHV